LVRKDRAICEITKQFGGATRVRRWSKYLNAHQPEEKLDPKLTIEELVGLFVEVKRNRRPWHATM
jgi:hypothetical protein